MWESKRENSDFKSLSSHMNIPTPQACPHCSHGLPSPLLLPIAEQVLVG